MIVFPLLMLASQLRLDFPWRRYAIVGASVVVALGVVFDPALALRRARLPATPGRYLTTQFDAFKHFPTCTGFLAATGIEGRLYNTYSQGGFLGFWLAPRLKALVNGTLNYPASVGTDERAIQRGGAGTLDALARNDVDVFFGAGLPKTQTPTRPRLYTTTRVERSPGWLPVFRSARCSVFLRRDENLAAKLETIAAFYAARRIPFDPAAGFDAGVVARRAPEFAERHGILPRDSALLAQRMESPSLGRRREALGRLAMSAALVGAYRDALRYDTELLAMTTGWPVAAVVQRRMVFALLQLDEPERALGRAKRLVREHDDAHSQRTLKLVEAYARLRADGARPGDEDLDLIAASIPLLGPDTAAVVAGWFRVPPLPWPDDER